MSLETKERAKPFLKWVGGKRKLAEKISGYFPFSQQDKFHYVEPFLGGGGMLFYMLEHYPNMLSVTVADINEKLMNSYEVVQKNPEGVIEELMFISRIYKGLDPDLQKEYFYKKRDFLNLDEGNSTQKAACFIFLNKTGFNGMYRVNQSGMFNVPHGSYSNPLICDAENIRRVSKALEEVALFRCSFKELEGKVSHLRPALAYSDPPYRPLSGAKSGFTGYQKKPFDDEDQVELKSFNDRLVAAGAHVFVSNSDSSAEKDMFLHELYSEYRVRNIEAARVISAKGSGRGKVSELIISGSPGFT